MNKYVKLEDAIDVASKECHEFRGIFSRIKDGINAVPIVEVSEDNKAYTYCSRCGMRVVMETPSVNTEQSSIVHCKDCVHCEQDLIVERSTDGYERKINLCHVSKPPKVVELHHYCGYGERIE